MAKLALSLLALTFGLLAASGGTVAQDQLEVSPPVRKLRPMVKSKPTPDRWRKVGAQSVSLGDTATRIEVAGAVAAKAVRVHAIDGAIRLEAVIVTYGQGLVRVEERPINLLRGERTRPIAIADRDQQVAAVDLVLTPGQGPGATSVEVWADASEPAPPTTAATPTAAAPPAAVPQLKRDPVTGALVIGKTEFKGLGYDREAVPVGMNAGLKTITLEAKGRPVSLDSVLVSYKDGTQDSVPVKTRLDAGQKQEVEVPSAKPVSNIAIKARSRIFDSAAKGQQTSAIEITGQPIEPPRPVSTRGVDAPASAPEVSAGRPVGRTISVPTGGPGGGGGPLERTTYSYAVETLDACVKAKTCTAIPVFFGTDRNQTTAGDRISFGTERAGKLQLGRVYVTVPRANREPGELNVPSGWSSWLPWSSGSDATRHFTIPKTGISIYASEADFIAEVKQHMSAAGGTFKDHAFVYVHGYRVPWEFAAMRTAQIAYDLSPGNAPFGTAFLYSWPSGGAAADYQYDVDSSRLAIPHLVEYLRIVAERTGAQNVHVIAHSMGNFPLMHALSEIGRSAPEVKINQVILAAPDVDKVEFETIAAGIGKVAKGVTLYASSSDYALLLSRLGRRNTPRAGDVKEPPGPALVSGIDTVDISRLSTGLFSWFSWNHDKYADSSVLLNDISVLFRKGERPPNLRNLSFRPEPPQSDPAKFWRYKE